MQNQQGQQFNQPYGMPPAGQFPPEMETIPQYEHYDTAERYGSIIKDLISTKKILDDYELQLRGKKLDNNNRVVSDPQGHAYVKSDRAARDYVNLLRSMVNTHNDMTYFTDKEAGDIIAGAIEIVPYWLMLQGDDVPLNYRQKIGFEGLSLINASLHKAINGRMLTFLKGSFSEGTSYNNSSSGGGGFLSNLWPFGKRK